MEVRHFENIDEKIYFETLENGMQVYLMPKPGFNKTYATFTTRYGSIDHEFVPFGESVAKRVPDGIAHFLEHKLFEKEDYDVFSKFSENSASSNAFTSFTRTCYLFSATSDLNKNLETLLDFVQSPYFTEETVEKEKGIIEEEIKMYADNADFKSYFGLLGNLYHNHPINIDIAGTVESIQDITADLLHECYNTFYHPSNMLLFVIGDFEPESIMAQIKENQDTKNYQPAPEIKRFLPDEPTDVATKERTVKMQTSSAKVLVGVKGIPDVQASKQELVKQEMTLEIICELLFGSSSEYYESLLDNHLANDTFSYEVTNESSFSFLMVGGDTTSPDELTASLWEKLLEVPRMTFIEDEFARIKKQKIGRFLSTLNSVEFIANQFTEYAFNGMNLFEVLNVLESLKLSDLHDISKQYFDEKRITVFTVLPE